MKLDLLIDIAVGKIFGKYLPWYEGLSRLSKLFLIYQLIAINRKQLW